MGELPFRRVWLSLGILLPPWTAQRVEPADCNQNGIDDASETSPAGFGFRLRGIARVNGVLEIADLNNDGAIDLLTSSSDENGTRLSTHLGTSQFRFLASSDIVAGEGYFHPSLGDLDTDGDLDLVLLGALGTQSRGVAVYVNDGHGAFRAGERHVGVSFPHSVVVSDVSQDGILDLATANKSATGPAPLDEDTVSILLGQGDATFTRPRNYAAGRIWPAIRAADFDGDRDTDLIAMHAQTPAASQSISVLQNDGAGAFPGALRSGFGQFLRSFGDVAGAGDFDGDERQDVVVSYDTGGLTVHFNDGTGRFSRPLHLDVLAGRTPVLTEDLDGDAKADIAIAGHYCTQAKVFLGLDAVPVTEVVLEPGAFRLGSGSATGNTFGVRSADFDGDGDKDLAVFSRQRTAFFANERSGSAADCDRNGIPDDCETDCNLSLLPDACDIALGASADCDASGIPDECEPDCDSSGVADACELASGSLEDCNANGIPDACEASDANGNGVPDDCDLEDGTSLDCNSNGTPDELDVEATLHMPRSVDRSAMRRLKAVDIDGDGIAELLYIGREGLGTFRLVQGSHSRSSVAPLTMDGSISAFAVADTDRDGDLDVVAGGTLRSCTNFGAIFTLESTGPGTFLRRGYARSYKSSWPSSLTIADFDGDGAQDVMAFRSDEPWLLLGDGAGEYDEAVELDLGGDFHGGGKGLALDFEGDGDQDLATDSGAVYLNPGNARLTAGPRFPSSPGALAAADLDGDGDTDFATRGVIARNLGNGAFELDTSFLDPDLQDVEALDIDGDAQTDLASASGSRLVLNILKAKEVEGYVFPIGNPPAFASLEAGDLNGDRAVDFVVSTSAEDRGLWLYPGSPRGSLTALGSPVRSEGFGFASIHAADLDGDLDRDLVCIDVFSAQQAVVVHRNEGNGRIERVAFPSVPGEGRTVAPLDLNADRALDLVVAGSTGLHILGNQGGGAFAAPTAVPGLGGLSAAFGGDLDRDGDTDLVALEGPEGKVSLAMQTERGRFEARMAYAAGEPVASLIAADANRDGDADLIVGTAKAITVLENDGAASLAPRATIPIDEGLGPLASADLDGDGAADLIAESHTCAGCVPGLGIPCDCRVTLNVHRNGGAGGYQAPRTHAVSAPLSSLTSSDLDLDGDLDIVATHLAGEDPRIRGTGFVIELFFNDGIGGVSSWAFVPSLWSPGSVAAEDLDGDGYPDLAIASANGLILYRSGALPPRAMDRDGDGIIDACRPAPFLRGDWTQDGRINITDPIGLLAHLFQGAGDFHCADSADADDNGRVEITDAIRLLGHLFQGAGPLPPPFEACGGDGTGDDLDCFRFPACR